MTKNDGTYAQLVGMSDKTKEGPARPKSVRTAERQDARPSSQGAVRPSDTSQGIRIVKHRPYSVYADQVRWLNRRKLDIEEEYGQLVTASGMVQLALDALIADFEANGAESQIVRVLVRGEPRPGDSARDRKEARGG